MLKAQRRCEKKTLLGINETCGSFPSSEKGIVHRNRFNCPLYGSHYQTTSLPSMYFIVLVKQIGIIWPSGELMRKLKV